MCLPVASRRCSLMLFLALTNAYSRYFCGKSSRFKPSLVRLPVSGDSTLVIPASVTLEGRDYRVEGVEEYAFCNHSEVRHLIVSDL